jgi:hypothetical protein
MPKLIVAVRNFAKAPENVPHWGINWLCIWVVSRRQRSKRASMLRQAYISCLVIIPTRRNKQTPTQNFLLLSVIFWLFTEVMIPYCGLLGCGCQSFEKPTAFIFTSNLKQQAVHSSQSLVTTCRSVWCHMSHGYEGRGLLHSATVKIA